MENINKLKEKYADKIIIESGYEVEYLPGEERNLQELKEETDILILGQHFIYDKNNNLKVFSVDNFTKENLMEYASHTQCVVDVEDNYSECYND